MTDLEVPVHVRTTPITDSVMDIMAIIVVPVVALAVFFYFKWLIAFAVITGAILLAEDGQQKGADKCNS